MKQETPAIIKISSYLWFLCSAIMLFTAVKAVVEVLNVENTMVLVVIILFAAILLPAYIFFRMGISSLRGTAKNTFYYGLFSISFSMLGVFNYLKTPHALSLFAIIVLFLAGALALYGKKKYDEYAFEINESK